MGNRFIKVYWAHSHHAHQQQQPSGGQGSSKHQGFLSNKLKSQIHPKPHSQKPWHVNKHHQVHHHHQGFSNPFPNQLQSGSAQFHQQQQKSSDIIEDTEKPEQPQESVDNSEDAQPAPTPAPQPQVKLISRAERAAKLKELADLSKSVQEAMQNQKHLMGKMTTAKTAKEKSAILKLLEVTMGSIKDMRDKCETIQNAIKPSLQTTKVNNRVKRSIATTTTTSTVASVPISSSSLRESYSKRRRLSQDTSTTNGDDDEEEEEVDVSDVNSFRLKKLTFFSTFKSTKRGRLSPPATISSSNTENELAKYAAKYEEELQRRELAEKEEEAASSSTTTTTTTTTNASTSDIESINNSQPTATVGGNDQVDEEL